MKPWERYSSQQESDAPASGPWQAYQDTRPAEPEDTGVTLGDYGRTLMKGGAHVFEGFTWLVDKFGESGAGQYLADLDQKAQDYWGGYREYREGVDRGVSSFNDSVLGGRTLREVSADASETWAEGLSEAAKQARSPLIRDDGSLDITGHKLGLMLTESLLGTAAGMGAGTGITAGLKMLPGVSRGVAATLGYSTGEALVAAPSAGAQAEREILAMSQEELSEHVEYQAMMLTDVPPGEAKKALADAAGGDAFATAAVATALLSSPFGRVLDKIVGPADEMAETTLKGNIGRGVATEAAQETLQSGAEQLAVNQAVLENADADRPLTEGVGEAMLGGALAGGAMGGAFGAAGHVDRRRAAPDGSPADPIDRIAGAPDVDSAIEAAVDAVESLGSPDREITNDYDPLLDTEQIQVGDGLTEEERADLANEALQGEAKPVLQDILDQARAGMELRYQEAMMAVPDKEKGNQKKPSVEMTLLEAIAAAGGLNREEAIAQGIDPASMNQRAGGATQRVFKNGGVSFDQMAENLSELGFEPENYSANSLLDKVSRSLAGEDIYSSQSVTAIERAARLQDVEAIEREIAEFEANTVLDEDDPPAGMFYDAAEESERNLGYTVYAAELAGVDSYTIDYLLDSPLSNEETEVALRDIIQKTKDFRSQFEPKRAREGDRQGDQGAPRQPEEPGRAPAAELTPERKKAVSRAAKALSEATGMSLKEARAMVESQARDPGGEPDVAEVTTGRGVAENTESEAFSANPEEAGGPWSRYAEPSAAGQPAADEEINGASLISQQGDSLAAEIDRRANEAATSAQNDRPEPTDAQKEAGNYKKGEPFSLNGQRIVIENPKASTRSGKDKDGNEWSNTMAAHYGDIKGTTGADGDSLDVFVGESPASQKVFIIDQQKERGNAGGFDEHKILMGFDSQEQAEQAYLDSYETDWNVGPISELTVEEFNEWVSSGDTTKPFAEMQQPQAAPDARALEQPSGQSGGVVVGDARAVVTKQDETLYHGTTTGNAFQEFDASLTNKGVGFSTVNQGPYLYLTDSETAAKFFSVLANTGAAARAEAPGWDSAEPETGNVLRATLKRGSKILLADELPSSSDVAGYKEAGFDAVRFPEKGFESNEYDPLGLISEMFANKPDDYLPQTTVVLNPDAVSISSEDGSGVPRGTPGAVGADQKSEMQQLNESVQALTEIIRRQTEAAEREDSRPSFEIKAVEGGFIVENSDGIGVVSSGRPDGLGDLSIIPPRVFKTKESARNYLDSRNMLESSPGQKDESSQDGGQEPLFSRGGGSRKSSLGKILDKYGMGRKEREAFKRNMASRPDGDLVQARLEEHADTPWAEQAVLASLANQAIKDILAGKEPGYNNPITHGKKTPVANALRAWGEEGIWDYLSAKSIIGHAQKPVNSVNGSMADCNPSRQCAKYCYATKGNYRWAQNIAKSEVAAYAIAKDPVRAGKMAARQYMAMPEYELNKALRLLDKGDLNPSWVPFVQEINRQGVRVQVFSKNPDILRQLDESNVRMLSIDESNLAEAESNPDLDVAVVYDGSKMMTDWVLENIGRVSVILPIKQGRRVLRAEEIKRIKADPVGKKKLCPIDAGTVKLGKWDCTKCDKNGGVGCFYGSVTEKVLRAATTGLQSDDEVSQLIQEIQSEAERLSGSARADLLANLESVLSKVRSGDDAITEITEPEPFSGSDIGSAEGDGQGGAGRGGFERINLVDITGGGDVREGGGVYEEWGVEAISSEGASDGMSQGDLFINTESSGEEKRKQLQDYFATTTANRQTGELRSATTKINGVQDLAHLVAPIRKAAQEKFMVVATGADGDILMAGTHTVGLKSSSQVDPLTVVAQVAGIDGVSRVHFAHNHPSGETTPSTADIRITERISSMLANTGIDFGHHVIVGSRGKAVEVLPDGAGPQFDIEPRVRSKSVPLVERTLVKRGRTYPTNINGPKSALMVVNEAQHDDALLLLDAQHYVVGVVLFGKEEMSALKNGGHVNRTLSAINTTNASAAIIKSSDRQSAENMAKMLNSFGMNVLDAFVSVDGGVAESDGMGQVASASGYWYSRGISPLPKAQKKTGATVSEVESYLKEPLEKLGQDKNIGLSIKIVQSIENFPLALQSGVGPGGVVKGAYYKNTVYIVADAVQNKRDARRTLAHELVGHKGVLEMAGGKEWGEIRDTIKSLIDSGHRDALSIMNEVDDRYEGSSDESKYKEFMAIAAERRYEAGPVKRIVSKFKEVVRRFLKLYGLGVFSESEIDIILSNSEAYLKRAGQAQRQGNEALLSTDSTAFQRWFGDSKAVNDDGSPKVFYHGTTKEFSEFNTDLSFFTEDAVTADMYSDMYDPVGGRLIPVYLSLQNPFDTRKPEHRKIFEEEFYGKWGARGALSEKGLPDWAEADDFKDFFEEKGYDFDGIYLQEPRGHSSVAVFNNTAVKSIYNQGTFDPSNPNILMSQDSGPESPEWRAAVAKGLDMSQEARMARAEAMGFDTSRVMYHGSPMAGFRTFEEIEDGNVGFYFTEEPRNAATYSGSRPDAGVEIQSSYDGEGRPGIYSVYLKMDDPYRVDFEGRNWDGSLEGRFDGADDIHYIIELAKSMGHDGVIATNILDEGPDGQGYHWGNETHVVFDPSQIRSVDAAFDPDNADSGDILFSQGAPTPEESQLDKSIRSISGRIDAFRFQVQDKLIDLKRLQQGIEEDGVTIEDAENAYQRAAIWEGVAGERLNDFDDRIVQPLLETIAQTGMNIEQVGNWLVARHAKEANEYLAEINPDMQGDARYRLSGMSNEEAAQILADNQDNAQLQSVGEQVDRMNRLRVSMLVQEGLLTRDMAEAWQSRYEHYVPLMRAEASGLDLLPSRGQGFSVSGKESKMRTGSAEWTPDKILTHAIAQMESSIVRAEKNKVGTSLLNLVKKHPDRNFWYVDTERKTRAVRDGKVVDGIKPFDSPNELTVKVNGEDVVIAFNPENERAMRLVKGLKNLGASEMNAVFRGMASVTRFLSQVNTSWNPEFMVANFARDLQTAGYNLTSTELDDRKAKVLAGVFPAMNGIRSALFGDGSAKWAPVWEDFRRAGGKTGWIDIHKDISRKEKDLQQMVERLRDGKPSQTQLQRLLEAVDGMNTVVENGVRLSAYKNALDSGLSREKAAALAKDLTVNFNRKGNMGPTMNALYMFYNASAQGSVRLLQTMIASSKGRKLAMATVGFAVMLDIINRSLSGDDDDGENIYDELPDYVKDHNLIIMGKKEPIVKIPLPWGYNVLHTMGQVIGDAISGERFSTQEAMTRVVASGVNAFNPVGSGTVLQTIAPTIADPLVMMGENKTFSGQPLKPVHTFDSRAPKPEYHMHWSSASEVSKTVAKMLNDLSGGTEFRPGELNISPEWIDLLWESATGGAGRFASNSVDVVGKMIQGKPVPTKTIPFARKVTGHDSQYGVQARYYDWTRGVQYSKREMEGLSGDELEEARERPEASMIGMFNSTEKRLRKLRKAKRALKAQNAPEEKIEDIDARMRELMARFNQRYAETVLE